MASYTKTCSLAKNLVNLTELGPRPVITWDQHERIRRNKEIWDNPESIVHRLPKHYQRWYWNNLVLAKRTPIQYEPPQFRFFYDEKRMVELETEEVPILPEHCPEQDEGLWGGEGVIKGYYQSGPKIKKKVLPRHWVPRLWFPRLKKNLYYSEVLNTYMRISTTERVLRLIDRHHGLDFYLLETPDIDINSRLGLYLKRQIFIELAKENYHPTDSEMHDYVKAKYGKFLIPLEEAEWYGLPLNDACRRLQDIEDNTAPRPLKYQFEEELVRELKQLGPTGEKKDEAVEKSDEDVEFIDPDAPRPTKWIGWKI